MKVNNIDCEFTLSAETVDKCSEMVRGYLKSLGVQNGDIIRYAMSVEEILIKYTEIYDGEVPVRLFCGKKFLRNNIVLEIDGKSHNIYLKRNNESGVLGESILKNLGISPEYSYLNDANTYSFRIKKKELNPILKLFLVLIISFAVGFLGLLAPQNLLNTMCEYLLSPLHDTFLNILGCIAGPMIFLSVAWGIYGIGDAATLKQIGKKLMTGYIGTVYTVVVILGLLALPLFSPDFSGNIKGGDGLSAIFTMILGIIPKNIFSPFVDGNTLQIIFLAVVIGIAMLFLGKKTNAVAVAVEQINYIVQFLIEFVNGLVPYFIFIVIVKMVWSDSLSVFAKVAKLFAVYIPAVIVMMAGIILYTALKNRVNPFVLARKGLPTLLIALTTASSAAAFGTNVKICDEKYGLDNTVTSFGLPLGMVTFKPTTALSFTIIPLFFAETYGISISPTWLILLFFSAGILGLATPPIPGGALTAYTVLFTQLGIPAEALAIALACDTLIDFISTGGDQYLIPFALINQAKKLGLVDTDVLKSKK